MKRKKGNLNPVLALVLLIAVAVVLFLSDDLELTTSDQAPAPAPSASQGEKLQCASYKEHRKDVNVDLKVPVLTDKKAPAYKVLEVTDGDTIVIERDGAKVRVRLMAMDTPERTTTRNGSIEHFGEEAYQHARKLIEQSGWEVRLTYDTIKTDKYGRDLAYVWLKDGRMLNAVMVADGYAYSYSSSPKPEYVDLLLGLMREARSKGIGLWGECE